MNVKQRNEALLRGELDTPGVFPHLDLLADAPYTFRFEIGLDRLPEEPGVLFIRGPRQYGKSTWLEGQLKQSAEAFGPGTALYLNGDELKDADELTSTVRELVALLHPEAGPHRLFIDELTAVRDWQTGLKRLLDAGELRRVLVVTTGSRATDLRRGAERLPGRKGRLDRTTYLFTPISFSEYRRVCGDALGDDLLPAYLLTGGCPLAGGELAASGRLPEFVIAMLRDWILGEFAASGRQRSSVLAVLECLHRFGGTPVGQARLAREAGLANNTVAAGYLELLADLMCVGIAPSWDVARRARRARRPAKFPLLNLAVATCFDPAGLRTTAELARQPGGLQGRRLEWLVAQELWRRRAVRGDEVPEELPFWQSREHELDFVLAPGRFVEVKLGRASALKFGWFARSFPGSELVVVNAEAFRAGAIRGVTVEEFLLAEEIA